MLDFLEESNLDDEHVLLHTCYHNSNVVDDLAQLGLLSPL